MHGYERQRKSALGQFYTNPIVSDVLVKSIADCCPKSIIDLGAGQGQLSLAARRRWESASIISVELDATDPRSWRQPRHHHFVGDALDIDLPRKLKKIHGEFDVAICNPPYITPNWRPDFERILAEAGLEKVCAVFKDVRADVLFLAQNLRMTKSGGYLGLIVPDGLISGERSLEIRERLLKHHGVTCAVSLPRGVFLGTEAKAHILVLQKEKPVRKGIRLLRLRPDGSLTPPVFVPRARAAERLDYEFHVDQLASPSGCISLRELGAEVARGSLSSRAVKDRSIPVFHTCDFPKGEARLNCALPSLERNSLAGDSVCLAKAGDILIARVDRNLERKVCFVQSGIAALSDCVLRVRVAEPWGRRVAEALLSPAGQKWLSARIRGVGARYITKSTVLDFRI